MLAKRLFDMAAAAAGLLVLLPVFLLIAALIRLDSPGPVLFRQVRVGRHGRPFEILKFRTMHVRAESAGQITVGNDPRITGAGRWLRHYKLDELPQLINVLRGEMSLVGPRPEVPRYVACYPAAQRHAVLSVKPGITDWAAIRYRDENALLAGAADPEKRYVEEILPVKLECYCAYVRDRSFLTDMKIILLTLFLIFRRSS